MNMQSQVEVVTSCNLQSDISTEDIPLTSILNDPEDTTDKVSICVFHTDGFLSFSYSNEDPTKKVDCGKVVKRLKVADDCHSYNVVLMRGCAEGTVRLSTTRPIAEGKQLSLWFSTEILAAIHVPFLTPVNIKGEKNYTCHKCNKIYEYPNPLKMHLSLNDCDKSISIENLLRKLYKNIIAERRKMNHEDVPTMKSEMGTSIHGLATTTFHGFPKLSYTPFDTTLLSRCRPYGHKTHEPTTTLHGSAFKPYRQRPLITCQQTADEMNVCREENFLPSTFEATTSLRLPQPQSPDGRPDSLRKSLGDEIDILERRAVDMETFVSNLGKLKHGHLCLYCGKVYSRKYGLKIHIRTHTGFKPLKCKYCLRPFGDPSNLNKHVRLHAEGETPYRCELCDKILVRRRDLERHMKSRHQTSPVTEGDKL